MKRSVKAKDSSDSFSWKQKVKENWRVKMKENKEEILREIRKNNSPTSEILNRVLRRPSPSDEIMVPSNGSYDGCGDTSMNVDSNHDVILKAEFLEDERDFYQSCHSEVFSPGIDDPDDPDKYLSPEERASLLLELEQELMMQINETDEFEVFSNFYDDESLHDLYNSYTNNDGNAIEIDDQQNYASTDILCPSCFHSYLQLESTSKVDLRCFSCHNFVLSTASPIDLIKVNDMLHVIFSQFSLHNEHCDEKKPSFNIIQSNSTQLMDRSSIIEATCRKCNSFFTRCIVK
jgi:hypothetical protein